MIKFITFCSIVLSCCFNLYGLVDCSITFNNLTNKKLIVNCSKNVKLYKLINGVYEEGKPEETQEYQSSVLDFNEKSEYKFVSDNDVLVAVKDEIENVCVSTVNLKNNEKPRMEDKKQKNTICRLYCNNLGAYMAIISDNEEKINREISSLEDPGMPQQWFWQK
ncbi:MAG: hypothetical protein LBG48_00220 [Rickettsiales bacterium]|nr:hypothetical protein [Rickettsiales bacterium]